MSYAAAKSISRERELFGKGSIDGLIAPFVLGLVLGGLP